jgi:hypothetical protein
MGDRASWGVENGELKDRARRTLGLQRVKASSTEGQHH